ncbi:hypothetical protein [Amycolatopsis suaedae]|uniref:hypothetical protein n=1 Tax=Amycolatopsis suaedae TaxID=2510978 RepID=UPI0030B84237
MTRLALLLFAAVGLVVGFWAAVLPMSFYSDFPGFRPGWVSADGPFNEHLVRDVGGMFLALGVLAVGAFVMRTNAVARLTGLAWLVFGVVHAAYHLLHLHVFEPVDQVINAVGLVGLVVLAAVVVFLPARTAQ